MYVACTLYVCNMYVCIYMLLFVNVIYRCINNFQAFGPSYSNVDLVF